MPFRVAIFHTSLPSVDRKIGGVEAAVHRLANTLANNPGLEVTVISCDAMTNDALYHYRRIFPAALNSRVLRLIILPLLLNFVNFSEFDVVHTHGDDWFWIWRRVPTVRTMHGSALREAQTATSLRRKFLQFLIYPLEHLSVLLATRSVAIGTDTKRLYSCDEIVGNGVNLSRFKPGQKATYPLLVFIGTWEGRKRGSFAFKTFEKFVLPRFPHARLHMVSDKSDAHPNVIWHRYLTEPALAALLAQAWVFCYPSVYEGFGIPYIEAMASGTAIVTTNNEGAREVLCDGEFGIICKDEEFGQRLVEILGDGFVRERFSELGLARAKNFNAEVVANRYLDIYKVANHADCTFLKE